MEAVLSLLDLERLRASPLQRDPFDHVIVEKFVPAEHTPGLIADFPPLGGHGSFPLAKESCGGAFARLAAEAILSTRLDDYAPSLSAALDRHASASWTAKRAADRFPWACFWAARSPGVFDTLAGLLHGDLRHPSQARGLARPPLRALSRLARLG